MALSQDRTPAADTPPLLLLTLIAGVTAAAAVTIPASFVGTSTAATHIFWYLGRAAGFVAYGLLFAAVVLGLGVSARLFDGVLKRAWVYEMHRFLSVFVLIFAVFHALIMLPDPYAQFTLKQLLVPFQADYRPAALALGILVLYASAIVSASFWLKGVIGQTGWRMLHYLTFFLFFGAMAHGILAGSDSGSALAEIAYLSTGGIVLLLTIYRVLAPKTVPDAPASLRLDARRAVGEN